IFWLPGGKHIDVNMVAGQAMWTEAGRHLPENASDSDMDVILVELKTPRRRPAAKKPTNTNAATNSNKERPPRRERLLVAPLFSVLLAVLCETGWALLDVGSAAHHDPAPWR